MIFRAWAIRSGPRSTEVRTTRQTVHVGMTSSLCGSGWRKYSLRPLSRVGRSCPLQDENPARPNHADFMGCDYNIEVWHRVLKSGCRIEARQLETAERLRRCLALYSVLAWRILYATMLARSVPEAPCSVLLDPEEWQALYCAIHRVPQPPAEPPSLAQVVEWIAQLGGFVGRRRRDHPGPEVLWRGFQHLSDLTTMYCIMRPPPS
jgi:hypothetical protein